ncbi:MAG: DUF5915 domain-containing protein [Acidimicrobiales bacterium]
MRLVPRHPSTSRALPGQRGVVVVDTTLVPDLEAEGLARDLVRIVQRRRRDDGLDVSDRIQLAVVAAGDVASALGPHLDMVAEQTLALEVDVDQGPDPGGPEWSPADLPTGTPAWVRVRRAEDRGQT